jgi:DNA processing protein
MARTWRIGLARDLAARGIVIVSGLARGIDAIAHQGAVTANGRAIGVLGIGVLGIGVLGTGVLGTGVDICYPKENKKLYEKVLERGAILSEFPLSTHRPGNFPIGNRIVAGMPLGAALTQLEQPAAEQRNLLVAQSLTDSGQKIYALLSSDEPRPIDDIVERTGLNSSDVLATVFDLEMKGFVRQLPGEQFSKILL